MNEDTLPEDCILIERELAIMEPQNNADERRFVNLNIQHFSEVYQVNGLIKSSQITQRAQSSAIPATLYIQRAFESVSLKQQNILFNIYIFKKQIEK